MPAPDRRAERRPRCRGCSAGTRAPVRPACDELLELVGLDPARTASATRRSSPAASSSGSGWRARSPPTRALMLMDEPFSAVDPIVRDAAAAGVPAPARARCRRRSLFVTHDIDEAIQHGRPDRRARARAARPVRAARRSCSRTRPTTSSREFVGADRALKALALVPLADLELEPAGARRCLEIGTETTARDALAILLSPSRAGRSCAPRAARRSGRHGRRVADALRLRSQPALETLP